MVGNSFSSSLIFWQSYSKTNYRKKCIYLVSVLMVPAPTRARTRTPKTFWGQAEKHDLVIFHCMNHKLQFAVTHTHVISRLRMFMDMLYSYTLYSFYWRSSQHFRLLESASTALGTEVKRIGKIFEVRWLPSSFLLCLSHCQQLLSNKLAETHHSQQKWEPMLPAWLTN